MNRVALLLLALALAGSALPQDKVRFIVTGDGRWNINAPRPEDENGVNVGALKKLVTAILAEKPKTLLFNGDLVGGGKTDAEQLSQFRTWQKAMDPIYDAGIKVLACRGNHEMRAPGANDVWKQAMSGKYANPGGGDGMTFSYTLGNVAFLALDEFGKDSPGVDQAWLDATLAKTKAKHIFAFAHEPAFFSGAHEDGMFTAPSKRDAFMRSLYKAGCRAVFFGHDHLYDHAAVKLATWKDEMHQFVVGTAGAPFYTGKALTTVDHDWTIRRIKHVEQKIGYCVVDVEGDKVTVTFKAEDSPGVFKAVDTATWAVLN
jgi:hypothetical protein